MGNMGGREWRNGHSFHFRKMGEMDLPGINGVNPTCCNSDILPCILLHLYRLLDLLATAVIVDSLLIPSPKSSKGGSGIYSSQMA
jgi:hypothetical protein